jgi:hypothetical protein
MPAQPTELTDARVVPGCEEFSDIRSLDRISGYNAAASLESRQITQAGPWLWGRTLRTLCLDSEASAISGRGAMLADVLTGPLQLKAMAESAERRAQKRSPPATAFTGV